MKIVKTEVFRPVRIQLASNGSKRGVIVCARTGAVLHVGSKSHLKRVAKRKFNVTIS